MSPAYDLLCTQRYPSLSTNFAMPIGEAASLEQLAPHAWKAFARDVGVGYPFLRERARTLVQAVASALRPVAESLDRSHPGLRRDVYPARRRVDFLRGLCACIEQNCKAALQSVKLR